MKKILLVFLCMFSVVAFGQKYDEHDLRKVNLKVDSLLDADIEYIIFTPPKEFLDEFEYSIERIKLNKFFAHKIIQDIEDLEDIDGLNENSIAFILTEIAYFAPNTDIGHVTYEIYIMTMDELSWQAKLVIQNKDIQFVKEQMLDIVKDYLHNKRSSDFNGYIYFTKDGKQVQPSQIKFH